MMLVFLSHLDIRSDQNFKTLGHLDEKRCWKDSSASPQKEQAEEDLMPILLRLKNIRDKIIYSKFCIEMLVSFGV